MKKLSKLRLNNATALNDKEMKDIVGGATESHLCPKPAFLYRCTVSYSGQYSYIIYTCAENKEQAIMEFGFYIKPNDGNNPIHFHASCE